MYLVSSSYGIKITTDDLEYIKIDYEDTRSPNEADPSIEEEYPSGHVSWILMCVYSDKQPLKIRFWNKEESTNAFREMIASCNNSDFLIKYLCSDSPGCLIPKDDVDNIVVGEEPSGLYKTDIVLHIYYKNKNESIFQSFESIEEARIAFTELNALF